MSERPDIAGPPRLARWLLDRMLGPDDEQVHGALADLWAVRVERDGVRSARLWYWRQTGGFLMRIVKLRRRRANESSDAAARVWGRPVSSPLERLAVSLRGLVVHSRRAVRSLSRDPGFALLSTLTLALGIGCTTAMFAVVNGVVLQPLAYEKADELMVLWPEAVTNVRAAEWFAGETRSFMEIAAISPADFGLTGDGPGERVAGARVSTNYFDVMGARFHAGRTFQAGESEPGRSNVAVLSYGLWQARYGGDAGVIGKEIRLDHGPYIVIGVLEANYRPIDDAWQVWTPQPVEPGTTVATDETWWMRTRIARLAPGATLESAQIDFRAAAVRLVQAFPEEINPDVAERATVLPLQTAVLGGYERTLWILLSIVGFVLLIACANVTNLLLARAERSHKDVAVRAALGAGRHQLVVQLMAESAVLGLASGVMGVLLAWGATDIFRAIAPADLPRVRDVRIDGHVLLFSLAIALLVPVLFGILPALRLARSDVRQVLAEYGRGAGASRRHGRMTAGLVASEIAMAVLVVTGATLLVRSLLNLRSVDPGFRSDQVLTFQVTAPPVPSGAASEPDMNVYGALWANIAALPGVESVGAIHILPLGMGNNRYPFWADGHSWPPGSPPPAANIRVATPGYVEAMQIPLHEGRWFVDTDRAESEQVVAINRALANRLWPGESAIGKRIWLLDEESEPWRVVGVIGDVRQMELARDASGEIYLPHDQWRWPAMYATVRTSVPPTSLIPSIRRVADRTDARITIARIAAMKEVVRGSLAGIEFMTRLTALFAVLALLLGVVGVYAVTTVAVSRRIPEFGLRMALGSPAARVIESTLRRDLRPVGAGLVLGLAAAWLTTGVLASLLFAVEPFHLPTYLAVATTIAFAALCATYLPARRATRANPLDALRLK